MVNYSQSGLTKGWHKKSKEKLMILDERLHM